MDEVEAHRAEVRSLAGGRLASVRYVTIDCARLNGLTTPPGPREVAAADEWAAWAARTWRYDAGDTLDYGLELTMADGRICSAAWDPPSQHEGMDLLEVPMVGGLLDPQGNLAVWDVSATPDWAPLIGTVLTDIDLHYLPWDASDPQGGYWCPRATLHFADLAVQLILVQADAASPELLRSATNLVALFPPQGLPTWSD